MKKKFKLNDLKVKSFVTGKESIKGGKPPKSEKSMIPNEWSWACCEMTVPC